MISATQKAQIRPVHPFPARMAPSIVWDALPKTGKSVNILDPMSGSGTTLVCARSRGHRAIGCDTDPLALLIYSAGMVR
jgi:tRNA G10  N-methylase Trm11